MPGNQAQASGRSIRSPAKPPARVVIIGCGFGGLAAARALRHAPVRLTVVDRANHHLFQPLLYQVATAGLAGPDIAAPVRSLLRGQRNTTTLLGEVTRIDPARRVVHLECGITLDYDHLVVAAGSTQGYFGHGDWAPHAPGLKTLHDAQEIRRRILLAFEAAERDPDASKGQASLNFIVIGGGPTGVEMAGTLAEIARQTLPGEFRRIDPSRSRVVLVESGARLLASMPQGLSESARRQLERLGVEVRTGMRVTGIDAAGIDLEASGSGGHLRIASRCVVWAAGVQGVDLGRTLALATGIEPDRAGRLPVRDDLTLPGHPEIHVIGDLCAALSHLAGHPPRPVPGVAPAAKQMGDFAGRQIVRHLRGATPQAFRYRDRGTLATIGRNSAVVDLHTPMGHLHLTGVAAWLFWLIAHIWFLIGFRNRVAVLADWAWAYWTAQRYARVVTDIEDPAIAPASRGGLGAKRTGQEQAKDTD